MMRKPSDMNKVFDQSRERMGYYIALVSALSFGVGQGVRKPGLEETYDPYFGAFISTAVALIMNCFLESRQKNFIERLSYQFKHINFYYVGAGICTSIAMVSFFYCYPLTYKYLMLLLLQQLNPF